MKLPVEDTYEMPVKSQDSARMECRPLEFNTKHQSETSTKHYIYPQQEYESVNQRNLYFSTFKFSLYKIRMPQDGIYDSF